MQAPAPVFISYKRDRGPNGEDGVSQRWAEDIERYLNSVGIGCWRDANSMRSGRLTKEISSAIEGCEVLLVIVSCRTHESDWVAEEINFAKGLKRPVLPVLVEGERNTGGEFGFLLGSRAWFEDFIQAPDSHQSLKQKLVQMGVTPTLPGNASTALSTQRQTEQRWLSDRVYKNRYWADREALYVSLTATETPVGKHPQSGGMKPRLDLSLLNLTDASPAETEIEQFDDVLEAFRSLQTRDIPQLALLGEPGSGKTFALQRLAMELAKNALDDPACALPLFVPLNEWTDAGTSLEDFLKASLGELGPYWEKLRDTGRAVLLLDAMNEIPSGQRSDKAAQIQDLIGDTRWAGVVVSCREHDFEQSLHLHLNKLCVRPLEAMQIREYACTYLGNEDGEACFWAIAGGEPLREALEVWLKAGATEQQFWTADEIPRENPDVYSATTAEHDRLWHNLRDDPRHLIRTARNPFLLWMLVEIYRKGREIPSSRTRLFKTFAIHLVEKASQQWTARQEQDIPGYEKLEQSLQALALRLQGQQSAQDTDVQTRIERADCHDLLDDKLLAFALDSGLLVQTGKTIGFQHQLIQETLAAPGLWQAIEAGKYRASDLWPAGQWWQRNGWEVTLDLLGESLDDSEKQRLIRWIGEANPDHASVLAEQWSVQPDDSYLAGIQERWLEKIADEKKLPHPHARAAAARALGRWGLDTRSGVGLTTDGLPNIAWVPIASEPFYYQDETKPRVLPPFAIARYLITNRQYQAFIDDGGYDDERWWENLGRRIDSPLAGEWAESNSPRENVSWYEAVAFCRWLSARTGQEVQLPTEQQFERVARGPNWRPESDDVDYPWRGKMVTGRANINETYGGLPLYLQRTSAVGVYPSGCSMEGVEDLAGNLWEWCLNEYRRPENNSVIGKEARALRGGSWFNLDYFCRSSYRDCNHPDRRDLGIGFRVSCLSPIT
ncbi:MAG: SUMF1/EgtB/PvdO family nonheme iron enzyme [Granulosicoccus sp.]